MRNGDFAVLVTALLFVRNLVLDLQRAGTSFDHLLGEKIGRLGVAETSVNVSDDRNHMGFVIVDGILELLWLSLRHQLRGPHQDRGTSCPVRARRLA